MESKGCGGDETSTAITTVSRGRGGRLLTVLAFNRVLILYVGFCSGLYNEK